MYRIEALQGNKVVAVEASWGIDEHAAMKGVDSIFRHKKIEFDGLRAVMAHNIYHATFI